MDWKSDPAQQAAREQWDPREKTRQQILQGQLKAANEYNQRIAELSLLDRVTDALTTATARAEAAEADAERLAGAMRGVAFYLEHGCYPLHGDWNECVIEFHAALAAHKEASEI
jgi:hypothetical protein